MIIEYFKSALFGIVQGLTEFLPISSSGHLVVLHELFDLPIKNEVSFDVLLHSATLLAVVYFFRRDILELLTAFFGSFTGKQSDKSKLAWYLLMATIPAALAGFFLEDLIESAFRNILVVAFMIFTVGLILFWAERASKKEIGIEGLDLKKSLLIGLAQALALIPGTSRSGITIIAGLFAGLKRSEAVRFSFLLSVPIIAGASIKKIPHLFDAEFSGSELGLLATAFIFSYLSGFFAIKYLLKFTRNHKLDVFAYYRIGLAVVLVLYFFMS